MVWKPEGERETTGKIVLGSDAAVKQRLEAAGRYHDFANNRLFINALQGVQKLIDKCSRLYCSILGSGP
jgi:hypothetical protein